MHGAGKGLHGHPRVRITIPAGEFDKAARIVEGRYGSAGAALVAQYRTWLDGHAPGTVESFAAQDGTEPDIRTVAEVHVAADVLVTTSSELLAHDFWDDTAISTPAGWSSAAAALLKTNSPSGLPSPRDGQA